MSIFSKSKHLLKFLYYFSIFIFLEKKIIMGVRGLLSFINSRQEEYFVPVQLSDCEVIIGNQTLIFSPKSTFYGVRSFCLFKVLT